MASERAALDLADRVVSLTAELLGDSLTAVILHGSLVFGDFVPDGSDLDLLAIVGARLQSDLRESLKEELVAEAKKIYQPLDFRMVTRHAASSPTRQPAMEFYVGLHGEELEVEEDTFEPDLLVEFHVARTAGRSLFGPEPSELIGPVPSEWILEYCDQVLERWEQLTDDSEHDELMVLTACRSWRFAEGGTHSSKREAALWALRQDSSLAAVQQALDKRSGVSSVAVDPSELGRLLARARDAVNQRLAG